MINFESAELLNPKHIFCSPFPKASNGITLSAERYIIVQSNWLHWHVRH